MIYKKLHKKSIPKKNLYKKNNLKIIGSKRLQFYSNTYNLIGTKKSINISSFYDLLHIFNRNKIINYSLSIILISLLFSLLTINNINNENITVSSLNTEHNIVNEILPIKSITTTTVPTSSTTTVPTSSTTIPVITITNIKDAQNQLKNLYIYQGKIDGINGTYTKLSLKEFQKRAGLKIDGILGPNTKAALEKGEDSYVEKVDISNEQVKTSTADSNISSSNTNIKVDLSNYNPDASCITGYINNQNVWVPDPCFYPVFVYRYGKVAQVNSQAEQDAYVNQNWSLTKEKTYVSLGKVPTQGYSDGYNSPVNGLPMADGSNSSIVIGIKNDNNVRARPQSGPESADAVVEVLVEGGMTRFINIFYQSDTSYHGPIRSARPTDPTVLRPLGGVLVASGATGGLIPEIVDMGVPVITDRRPEFFRISNRNAPHNLYADTAKLKQLAVNKGYKKYTNPQPLFPWGNPSLTSWISNSYLKLSFSSYTSTTWTWDGNKYLRTYYDAYKNTSSDNIHYWINENGNQEQITTQTVIALFCEPYIHPLQLPSVKTIGEGRAIILHKGKLLDARWKRGSNLDPFHIVDKNDNILYVPKGKVWISLVPNTKNPSFG